MQYSVLPTVNNLGLLFYVTALQKMKTDHPSSSTTRGGPDKLQTHTSSTPISSKGKAAQEHCEDGSLYLATAAGTPLLPSHLWTTRSFFSSKCLSHTAHTGIMILQSLCLPWWQSVPYLGCVKVHIGPHHKRPRSARWAVYSHSPEQAMCFWSRPVMGHDSSLTLDPTHTLTVHTRLQTCPSFFRSYVHFSHEREIFLVMWWQRHCKVTQKEWQDQMNLSDMPNFVCRSQDDLSTENTVQ